MSEHKAPAHMAKRSDDDELPEESLPRSASLGSRILSFFKDIEPLINILGLIATTALTIVVGVATYEQGQRQEALLDRQVQIEHEAADPEFALITPRMLGRNEADRFIISKAAGTAYDLNLSCYDLVFLELPNPEDPDRPIAIEVRCFGRFNHSVDISNGITISVSASTDFSLLESAFAELKSNLRSVGLEETVLVNPELYAVLDLSYVNQSEQSVERRFLIDPVTGVDCSTSLNYFLESGSMNFINRFRPFILDIGKDNYHTLAKYIREFYDDYNLKRKLYDDHILKMLFS